MNTYTPQTYVSGTVQPVVVSALPVGPPPQPLPSSAGYVAPPNKKGFTSSIRTAWDKLTSKAEIAWNEQTDERFRKYFGFPYSEQLYGEFWGEVWTGGQLTPCSVFISANWLCISAKVRDAYTHAKLPMKAQILLSDIIRVQPAIALPASRGGAPVIQALNDPSIRPDSLQVFTRNGMAHQFANFFNFDKFVSTLEYLWHSSTLSIQSSDQPYLQPAPGTLNQPTPLMMSQPLSQPAPVMMTQPTLQPPPVIMTKEYQPAQVQPPTQAGAAYR